MDLSIVIVNWNTRELLRDCLASLPDAVADLRTETFVVDNASADGSAGMVAAQFPHVTLLETGANLGFAAGNNLALPRTRGQAVLLLNPDTVCPPHSLSRLYAFLHRHPRAAAAGPRLVDHREQPTLSCGFFPRLRGHWLGVVDPQRLWLRGPLANRISLVPDRGDPSCPVEYVLGACLMMTRAALDRIGGLDDRFFLYFEETDWCYRAWESGWEIWYCAEVEIQHLAGAAATGVGEFAARQFQVSYRRFLAKHYGEGCVRWFRLAQFAEFGAKSLLRRLVPSNRSANRRQASALWRKARLQLVNNLEARPPQATANSGTSQSPGVIPRP